MIEQSYNNASEKSHELYSRYVDKTDIGDKPTEKEETDTSNIQNYNNDKNDTFF